ncbi:MAG: hypothetical protein U1E62_05955 [Alsobacter sp.]
MTLAGLSVADAALGQLTLASLALTAFSFFNALRIVSYLPQILRVARDRSGATPFSYGPWAMWTLANLSTAAYAVVKLQDAWLALVSLVNTGGCLAVILLTVWKRRQARRLARRKAVTSGRFAR